MEEYCRDLRQEKHVKKKVIRTSLSYLCNCRREGAVWRMMSLTSGTQPKWRLKGGVAGRGSGWVGTLRPPHSPRIKETDWRRHLNPRTRRGDLSDTVCESTTVCLIVTSCACLCVWACEWRIVFTLCVRSNIPIEIPVVCGDAVFLHSCFFFFFSPDFLFACTHLQIPGTSVCIRCMAGHFHMGPATGRDSISYVCCCIEALRGHSRRALWYLRNMISLQSSSGAKSIFYYGQFIYSVRGTPLIWNGKMVYCTALTQKYWIHSSLYKLLTVRITLDLCQWRTGSFKIRGGNYIFLFIWIVIFTWEDKYGMLNVLPLPRGRLCSRNRILVVIFSPQHWGLRIKVAAIKMSARVRLTLPLCSSSWRQRESPRFSLSAALVLLEPGREQPCVCRDLVNGSIEFACSDTELDTSEIQFNGFISRVGRQLPSS